MLKCLRWRSQWNWMQMLAIGSALAVGGGLGLQADPAVADGLVVQGRRLSITVGPAVQSSYSTYSTYSTSSPFVRTEIYQPFPTGSVLIQRPYIVNGEIRDSVLINPVLINPTIRNSTLINPTITSYPSYRPSPVINIPQYPSHPGQNPNSPNCLRRHATLRSYC